MSHLRAGFIGLDEIGLQIARHLACTFPEVAVYDPSGPAISSGLPASITTCSSPAEVARVSEVIGINVADREISSILSGPSGLLAGIRRDAIVLFHASTDPETIVSLARSREAKNVALLDAVLTGGSQQAAQGGLAISVGGESSAVERARPYLEAFSSHIVHVGALGSGIKAKAACDMLLERSDLALKEAMILALQAGARPEAISEVLGIDPVSVGVTKVEKSGTGEDRPVFRQDSLLDTHFEELAALDFEDVIDKIARGDRKALPGLATLLSKRPRKQ